MRWRRSLGALVLLPALAATAPGRASAEADLQPSTSSPSSVAPQPPAVAPSNAAAQPAPVASDLAGQTPREIRFRGNTTLSTDRLLKLMATKPGQPMDLAVLERDLTAIEQDYRRHGYTLMRALSPEPLSPDGVFTIPIQEGVVEAIQVVGNKKTRRWVILRQMETHPGEVYNERVVRDDRQRLANLAIFQDVQVGSAAGTKLGKAVVTVKVIEAKTAELATTLGYDSKNGLLGYFYGEEDNLAGTARQVNLRWERFALINGSAAQGSFYTPWSPIPRTSLRVSGYHTSPYRFVYATSDMNTLNVRSYEIRTGGSLQLARELTVRNQLLFGFRNDSFAYDDLPFDVQIPAGYTTQVGTVRVLSLGLANDTRDLPFNPRRGGVHTLNVEFGTATHGGQYTRYTANLRRYYPVGKTKVLANRLMLGTSSGDVPLPELFWLGGPDTLRGYDRDSFYGRSAEALTSELRIPIGTGMQAVRFVDAGHASGNGGLKGSIGVGFRVVTPIGPLRFDFAVGADGGRTHFTAGHGAF